MKRKEEVWRACFVEKAPGLETLQEEMIYRAGDIVHLVSCLPGMLESLVVSLAPPRAGMMGL